MSYVNKSKDIDIDEATTHGIEITPKDSDDMPFELEGYEAVFTSIRDDNKIEKICSIEDNKIFVVLNPTETSFPEDYKQAVYKRNYQVRIFKDDIVYQIASGSLIIHKVHKNYINSPYKT
ncbi:MAG: hypothetical protein PUE66_08100 [Erysipelotrichaceae bacterium]|nr:hypothetical protein [Erysipelotrichaceae bacterium]